MSTEMKWRELALQFDGHRMQALSYLKYILSVLPEDQFPDARNFLKEGPTPGDEILRQRLEAVAKGLKK